jgi:N6-adenosine-specific RNA methylase IME4
MIPFPDKKYKIIYADPPWTFNTFSEKGKGRSPEKHYDCMTLKDIENLPIGDLADTDCALFMWCTDPLLHKQLPLVEKWGFKYKTVGFHWVKTNKNRINNYFFKGAGYWTRANPEICILATKGSPKRINKNINRLVVDERREHSRKPDRIRNDIVELCGDLPRIELFSRSSAKGWDSWGNQTEKFG